MFSVGLFTNFVFFCYIPTPLSDETYRRSLQVLGDIVVLISPALLCCLNALGAQQVYAQTTAAWRTVFGPYHAISRSTKCVCIKMYQVNI
jgi:hypothetical protein